MQLYTKKQFEQFEVWKDNGEYEELSIKNGSIKIDIYCPKNDPDTVRVTTEVDGIKGARDIHITLTKISIESI